MSETDILFTTIFHGLICVTSNTLLYKLPFLFYFCLFFVDMCLLDVLLFKIFSTIEKYIILIICSI